MTSHFSPRFGPYGGQYVPETLIPPLQELEQAFTSALGDAEFKTTLDNLLKTYVGRPTPLTYARRLSAALGGAQIYLKREDLAHSGAHKINNALGQALLAQRMGKRRVVAETGAGQHGVATATACALLGLECVIYMGDVDMARQQPNVLRMRLLGAEVRPVTSGSRTLKDAVNEAIRDWVTHVHDTYYLIGSALGPHPYPHIVREFQAVIGQEARAQIQAVCGRLPDVCIACVGGGSNAIGLFSAFLDDASVRLIGVEAGGLGLASGQHAARLAEGAGARPGVLHGNLTYLLQDEDGQVLGTHSISAGLDYPAVGPQHAWLHEQGRVTYTSATDHEALQAFQMLARLEGILPALESAHALAEAIRLAPQLPTDAIILVNLSGRGDKDLESVARALETSAHVSNLPRPSRRSRLSMPSLAPQRVLPAGEARITRAFDAARALHRPAIIPYFPLGYPSLGTSLDVIEALAQAGADLIELGIPFSDPLADGPTIQQASQIALAQGMSVPTALEMTRQLRQQGVQQPCLFMSYLNPLLAYGLEAFIRDASRAGIDGLIIPDLPLEESIPVRRLCQAHDLALIPLIPPNLSMGRIAQIVQDATGFLYLVSVTGVTGVRDSLPPDLGSFLRRVRQITPLPLAVGFGIASPEQVQALYPLADGVIVGSALIRAVASSNQPLEAAANFLRALVHAAYEVKSA